MRLLWVLSFASLVLFACGDDQSSTDAAADAEAEAEMEAQDERVTPVDLGPPCDPPCGVGERCCEGADGLGECVDLLSDTRHCGRCGRACVEEERGDRCEFGNCSCGLSVEGCSGVRSNLCCPPREDGGFPYCANLERDPNDCGSCGAVCNPLQADRCDGGQCRCGENVGACEGTTESTCCRPTVGDIECVNLNTDIFHCGGCDIRCEPGEFCVNGTCTLGEGECDSCVRGNICCGGTCCFRDFCFEGMCDEG
ncbi:MAG: hypothetical protein AAF411_12195 [Myxococcota bacterium]